MENILVTGGAGFIGSNFIRKLLEAEPSVRIVNLDKLTYAARKESLVKVADTPNYQFVEGDICDRQLVERLFSYYNFDAVFHFAAESHVDNSIAGPEVFITTNVLGTFTLLDVARKAWMSGPFEAKVPGSKMRFLHVSTDEVYGSLGETGLFTELTPYAPNSPYSASKASSDMIVRSYFHTFGLDVVTTNCSNNYGPHQHEEKLIPTIIKKALNEDPIPIYGDGKNIRDWLFVDDHCEGILLAFNNGRSGETYNIGGMNEKTNIEIARLICGHLQEMRPRSSGSYEDLITFVGDRPGHDKRYAIDASKIENELGWKARESFETGIVKTIANYLAFER